MTKSCTRCQEEKELECFSAAPSKKDGYASLCKACTSERNRDYWRTPEGRMSQIYSVQKANSKVRGHPPPSYTKDELFHWAISKKLSKLIKDWKDSNYDKALTPSVDRLDVIEGYTLDNIRLVTWKENNDAQYESRRTGRVITKQNRKVRQMSLDGNEIATYPSVALAARVVGVKRPNLNAMCSGINPHIKSVGGYLWEYCD